MSTEVSDKLWSCCDTGEKCAVVYVSSYCPACRKIESWIPQIDESLFDNHDMRLCAVVGDKEEYMRKLDASALFDRNKSIARDLKVTSIPAFYTIDLEGDYTKLKLKSFKNMDDIATKLANN